jgi:hypothetical protein
MGGTLLAVDDALTALKAFGGVWPFIGLALPCESQAFGAVGRRWFKWLRWLPAAVNGQCG